MILYPLSARPCTQWAWAVQTSVRVRSGAGLKQCCSQRNFHAAFQYRPNRVTLGKEELELLEHVETRCLDQYKAPGEGSSHDRQSESARECTIEQAPALGAALSWESDGWVLGPRGRTPLH